VVFPFRNNFHKLGLDSFDLAQNVIELGLEGLAAGITLLASLF
jgi:hypothetical protein